MKNIHAMILASALTTVLAVLVVIHMARVSQEKKSMQIDRFHFEVTPEKTCAGGPYMWSSASPEKKAYCESLTKQQYDMYNCPRGFIGMPVRWSYTPESDSKWQNPRCTAPDDGAPCPL